MFQNQRDNLYDKHVDFRELLYRSQQTCSDPNMGDGGAVPKASGEILTALDLAMFSMAKLRRWVKQTLAAHVGVSRFRQRLFVEDAFREIQDDVRFLDRLPCKCSCLCWSSCCQMLREDERMISPCRRNDSASVEQFLQGP